MADLVFGLAKTAVNGTVSMAKSAIVEEKKLKKSVQGDLMLISDELEMMHSFLNVANERTADDMARTCVRQVRDMALDVEDCIESIVQLDNKPKWWRRLVPSCMPAAAPAAALDNAVSGIELLKARVEAMGQRNMRYSHLSDSSSKPTEQMHQPALANATESDILFLARDAAKSGLLELVKLINNKDHVLQVISVWTTGGDLGTTSIIRKACDDPEIYNNFKHRAWVKLPCPFNPHAFLKILLTQFYTNYCLQQGSTVDVLKKMEVVSTIEGGLVDELMTQFSDQKYLIILEDVSTMVEWDTIRAYLPDRNNGSCIIVHTQQLEIASLCIGHSHRVWELERFSVDHSVCVFFNEDGEKGEKKAKKKAAQGWLDKFQLVGRQTDLYALDSFAQSNIQVSSVWGIAGVGKSSLVKQLYCERVVKGKGFDKFGWVNVTHPFNLRDLLRSLLMDLYFESVQHGSISRIKDPILECRKLVHKDRCFIVIDGLQSTEEWDLIKYALAYGHPKSRIIVITNDKSIATYCAMGSQAVWNIKGLEVDEALDLFKMKVCSGSFDQSPEVTEQAKLILHKCGGLPKVIVAIAGHVHSWQNLEFWSSLNIRFMKLLEAEPTLSSLFAWVHSYFHSCPDLLKPCMFYLSIFPAMHSIHWRRLVRRWIAEGYARDTKDSTAEETAKKLFSQLIELSIIQPLEALTALDFFEARAPYRVNGFFREYIITRSIEQNLVFTLEGHCCMNSQRTGRHLSIGSKWDRDRNLFESIDFSRLRSLTVFGKWRSFFISDKMCLLRVLDLEDASGLTDKDLEQIVKRLRRLKFLSLRGCTMITRLPDSLGDLRQLQTLDVRNTGVIVLPSDIIKLQKLQYIHAGTTVPSGDDDGMDANPPPKDPSASLQAGDPSTSPRSKPRNLVCCLSKFFRSQLVDADNAGGVMVPREIGKLSALHTLGVVNINSIAGGDATLEELKKLTQLHKLGVCGVNRKNSQVLCSFVSDHGHLESLSVRLDKVNQDGCLDGISPPPENLRSLKLHGLAGKLPVWIKDLQSLRKLSLQITTVAQDDIDVLGDLPQLSILCLCLTKLFQDGELHFQTDFRRLVALEIACNSRLKAVKFSTTSGRLANIEVLKIRCYSVSSLQFPGLEFLQSIKEVFLSGNYGDAVKLHLQSQLARQQKEIGPVLKERPSSS